MIALLLSGLTVVLSFSADWMNLIAKTIYIFFGQLPLLHFLIKTGKIPLVGQISLHCMYLVGLTIYNFIGILLLLHYLIATDNTKWLLTVLEEFFFGCCFETQSLENFNGRLKPNEWLELKTDTYAYKKGELLVPNGPVFSPPGYPVKLIPICGGPPEDIDALGQWFADVSPIQEQVDFQRQAVVAELLEDKIRKRCRERRRIDSYRRRRHLPNPCQILTYFLMQAHFAFSDDTKLYPSNEFIAGEYDFLEWRDRLGGMIDQSNPIQLAAQQIDDDEALASRMATEDDEFSNLSENSENENNPVQFKNTCYPLILRELGYNVAITMSGPFWAMRDGNRWLDAFNVAVVPCPTANLSLPGKYVIHRDAHFLGVENTGDVIILHNPANQAVITSQIEIQSLRQWVDTHDVTVFKLSDKTYLRLCKAQGCEPPWVKARDRFGGGRASPEPEIGRAGGSRSKTDCNDKKKARPIPEGLVSRALSSSQIDAIPVGEDEDIPEDGAKKNIQVEET